MNKYNESILPNGLKIITSENPNSEIVILSVWVKAGSRYEEKSQLGYAHILEHMLLIGTKKYPTAFDTGRALDRVGAASNAFTNPERIYIFIQVVKKHLEKMFEILSDMTLSPVIDSKVLENEKEVILQELYRQKDNYGKYLWKISSKKLFGNHPLSRDPLGDENSIKSATSAQLFNYHKKFFIPDRSAVVAVGGLTHEKISELAKKYFGDWQVTNKISDNFQEPEINKGFIFEKAPSKQTHIVFKYGSPKCNIEELAALEIIGNYLSYGDSSVLKQEVRIKRGLVYSVSAGFDLYQDATVFFIQAATTKPKETTEIVLDIMRNLDKNFTVEIFDEIKEQTASAFIRGINDPFSELGFLGKGWQLYEKIISPKKFLEILDKIRHKDVIAVANKYLSEDRLLTAAIGNEEFKINF